MAFSDDWRIPASLQPDPAEVTFDLDRTLAAVVGLTARVPANAYTAETLGTDRAGQGVVIRADDLVLTIGYLIAEAERITLETADGHRVEGHTLAYDYATGFGLVQALEPIGVPPLPLGASRHARRGDAVIVAGAGGRARSLAARIVARQEFAGYWEYVLEDAIFTAPAHPHWGGAALIGTRGDLVGIASLQVPHLAPDGRVLPLNMSVPIDRLVPILDDLVRHGRALRPPRPWLGLFAAETEANRVQLIGLAGDGPAKRAGLRAGDVVQAVAGREVRGLAEFYRAVWALGEAGVDVPLTLEREDDSFDLVVTSADRARYLKAARAH